jgi:hypothetical protein
MNFVVTQTKFLQFAEGFQGGNVVEQIVTQAQFLQAGEKVNVINCFEKIV